MIPSFKPGIMSSNQIRAAGGGGDVTPDAVNWNNVSTGFSPGTTNTQTFTGINTTITLSVSWTISGTRCTSASSSSYYIKNGGAEVQMTSSPATISISNNDTLAFKQYDLTGGANNCTLSYTVTNTSDANTVLDTFTMLVADI